MATLSASRRNSANSNPTTPRASISGSLVPRMSSLEEEKLLKKVENVGISNLITDSFDENDEHHQKANNFDSISKDDDSVSNEKHKVETVEPEIVSKEDPEKTDDILTQLLPYEQSHRTKKEVSARACSERSDSGISDCSTHTHMTSNSSNSTPLLGKKFPINEESFEETSYVSSTSINLRANSLRKESDEVISDGVPQGIAVKNGKCYAGRLGSKIETFNATVAASKSEFFALLLFAFSVVKSHPVYDLLIFL